MSAWEDELDDHPEYLDMMAAAPLLDGPAIQAELVEEWLAQLPRQQRRAFIREGEKRGEHWLYRTLASQMGTFAQIARRRIA